MNDLSKRLQNVQESGVYRLNCSLDDLRKTTNECGFVLFEAKLVGAHGKGEILAELADSIAAPDWFGHNWDALTDALSDLSWRKSSGYVLLLHGNAIGEEILLEILDATVQFWKLQGKAFWVFFS